MRLPRKTLRLRLTLLYGGLFAAACAVLLFVTWLLIVQSRGHLIVQGQTAGSGPGTGFYRAEFQQVASNAFGVLFDASLIALACTLLVTAGLGWFVAGRALRPLRAITAMTRHLSANNLHHRLALTGADDELMELSDTFDGLLDRLEAAFTAQRQFVSNASHELRTPLARQRAQLEVALDDPAPTMENLTEACHRALAAGAQQERLIEALFTLARGERGLDRREPVDVAAITEEVVLTRYPLARRHDIAVDTTLEAATAAGDPRLAERLVANLVDNAIGHNVPGGRVEVATRTEDGRAVVSVANTGPAIPRGMLGRLFEPFQRVTPDRVRGSEGLGLGLSIVVAIAGAHGAAIHARARPSGGLHVTVTFPPAAGAGATGSAQERFAQAQPDGC